MPSVQWKHSISTNETWICTWLLSSSSLLFSSGSIVHFATFHSLTCHSGNFFLAQSNEMWHKVNNAQVTHHQSWRRLRKCKSTKTQMALGELQKDAQKMNKKILPDTCEDGTTAQRERGEERVFFFLFSLAVTYCPIYLCATSSSSLLSVLLRSYSMHSSARVTRAFFSFARLDNDVVFCSRHIDQDVGNQGWGQDSWCVQERQLSTCWIVEEIGFYLCHLLPVWRRGETEKNRVLLPLLPSSSGLVHAYSHVDRCPSLLICVVFALVSLGRKNN